MKSNNLLIVEESLRDMKAHWFEYIKYIVSASETKGWNVDVASNVNVVEEIKDTLNVYPVFKYSKYLDVKRLPGERFYGFVLHSLRSLNAVKPLFQQKTYDFVFCPTVTVHHLLMWRILLALYPSKIKTLCLFFVTNPGVWDKELKQATLPKSSKLMGLLLKSFKRYAQEGKVLFAVETRGAKNEFEALSGLIFRLLPHAVPVVALKNVEANKVLNFACYGFARYEKGSDILQKAIVRFLKSNELDNIHFTIQWTDVFGLPDGELCDVDEYLINHPNVTILTEAFGSEKYNSLLASTDVMLLPYRNSSYYARVSRVAIEATNNGIPCIYTKGGWLEDTISEYGAGIGIEDEDTVALEQAIGKMYEGITSFKRMAQQRAQGSVGYFSPRNFCKKLLV